jgi:predicted  nucleic acid-binding Zn-ribbon protein
MLTEVLDKVKALARGKRAAVLTGYQDAVRQVASGAKTDPERVAQVLDAAGIDPEKFEADVTAHAERVGLAGIVAKRAGAEKVLATAQAGIADLEKKLEEKVAEIRQAAAPMHDAVRQAERDLEAARQAEAELVRTYPQDGPARAELAEAQKRAAKLDAERHELRASVRRFEGEVAAMREKIGRDRNTVTMTGTALHPADPGSLAYAETTLADLRRRLAESEKESAALAERMEAASRRMGQA